MKDLVGKLHGDGDEESTNKPEQNDHIFQLQHRTRTPHTHMLRPSSFPVPATSNAD